mmetsp:Transcript_39159/g.85235  ORF Transcript_39159/g.85235 Transcript_39159/m.85235 type:complete len:282 (-) Transcript_39159:1112-1957(-)
MPRDWPLPGLQEAPHVDVDLGQGAQEGCSADPWGRDSEQRPKAVGDEYLVKVGEGVIGFLLRLLLRRRHLGELQLAVAMKKPLEGGAVVSAAPPELQFREEILDSVRHCKAKENEDRQLRLKVEEAVIAHTTHFFPKEMRVVLEQGHIVEHKVRVDELQTHHLRQQMHLMFGLGPVVLSTGQPLSQQREKGIRSFHKDSESELEGQDTAWYIALQLMAQEEDHQDRETEQRAREDQGRRAECVVPHPLRPGVVRLHLGSHRVDPRLAVVLRASRLQVVCDI